MPPPLLSNFLRTATQLSDSIYAPSSWFIVLGARFQISIRILFWFLRKTAVETCKTTTLKHLSDYKKLKIKANNLFSTFQRHVSEVQMEEAQRVDKKVDGQKRAIRISRFLCQTDDIHLIICIRTNVLPWLQRCLNSKSASTLPALLQLGKKPEIFTDMRFI